MTPSLKHTWMNPPVRMRNRYVIASSTATDSWVPGLFTLGWRGPAPLAIRIALVGRVT